MGKLSYCLGMILLFSLRLSISLYGLNFRVILISRTGISFEFRGLKISRIFVSLAKFRIKSREILVTRKFKPAKIKLLKVSIYLPKDPIL